MAKTFYNVFVDVTGKDETPFVAQHRKHFPGSVIGRIEFDGRTILKVPYAEGEARCQGMTLEELRLIQPANPATVFVQERRP